MLNLRSFRDFPEIFTLDVHSAVLCKSELDLYHGISGPLERRLWLLSWVTTKELVQRHCSTQWGWTPKALDFSLESSTRGGFSVHFGAEAEGETLETLHAEMTHSDRYAAACVRPLDPEMSFGLCLNEVARRFPFIEEERFSRREMALVRACDTADVDQMLTGFMTLKGAATEALHDGNTKVVVTALLGGGRADLVVVGAEGGAFDGPALRALSWYFDQHTLAYVAAWADPANATDTIMKIEEDPVLPEARHSEDTI